MSERDELADLLAKHEDCAFSASGVLVCTCGTAMQPNEAQWDLANLAAHQAAIILAAGYRRPRTITTVEELKALRLPAIIDSPAGGPARVEYYAGPGLQQRYVEPLFCDDDSDTECYSPQFFATLGLPATVLHEPEATL